MIPALYDRRMSAVDSVIAQAVLIMVIDDSAGLQVGVYRDRTDVFETALLQVPADLIRQTVADRDRSCVVSLIEDRFSIGKAPDIIAEYSFAKENGLGGSGVFFFFLSLCPLQI